MTESIYEKLRLLIDHGAIGFPSSDEIIPILKILYTEDEAKVALGLSFMPLSVEKIALRSGVNEIEAKNNLESLANKGLIYACEKAGIWEYVLVSSFVILESAFWRRDPETAKMVAPLIKKYHSTYSSEFGTSNVAATRVIPIQEQIELNSEVFPYEKLNDMIDQADVVGMINACSCKSMYQNCNSPSYGCMIFDETCKFFVDRGLGKYLTKEEMKKILLECDEAGLVHVANNIQEKLNVICHCCSCCCLMLQSLTKFGNPNAIARSPFYPEIDLNLCDGCGKCVHERCPMGALEINNGNPVLKIEQCIGCALCASGCPNNAIEMTRRLNVKLPPATTKELGGQMLIDKGKLDKFMTLMSDVENNGF